MFDVEDLWALAILEAAFSEKPLSLMLRWITSMRDSERLLEWDGTDPGEVVSGGISTVAGLVENRLRERASQQTKVVVSITLQLESCGSFWIGLVWQSLFPLRLVEGRHRSRGRPKE